MTTLPMAAMPPALPGMLPLPGTTPTPHDPTAADPFVALLTQLVGPAPVEAPPTEVPPEVPSAEEAPVAEDEPEDEPVDAPVGAPVGAPVDVPADLPAEAEAAVPVLPVAIQLPTILPTILPAILAAILPVEVEAPAQDAVPEMEPAVATTPAPAPDAPAPVTPVATAAPPAPLTNRSVTPETPAPVARQVFPEVVRAAVTGVTPNRVVVRLEPEHLGEVRVVLRTTRSGTLEVSLAGGPEARSAMREGAPELRRLLEAAGSHDAKVVVRHLAETTTAPAPATPASPQTTTRSDVPTTAGGLPVDVGAGTAGGSTHGSSPGTTQGEERRRWATQDARPGAMDGIPDPTVEATRAAARRSGGLDVMM